MAAAGGPAPDLSTAAAAGLRFPQPWDAGVGCATLLGKNPAFSVENGGKMGKSQAISTADQQRSNGTQIETRRARRSILTPFARYCVAIQYIDSCWPVVGFGPPALGKGSVGSLIPDRRATGAKSQQARCTVPAGARSVSHGLRASGYALAAVGWLRCCGPAPGTGPSPGAGGAPGPARSGRGGLSPRRTRTLKRASAPVSRRVTAAITAAAGTASAAAAAAQGAGTQGVIGVGIGGMVVARSAAGRGLGGRGGPGL